MRRRGVRRTFTSPVLANEEDMMATQTTTEALLERITVRSAMQLGLFECGPDADLRELAHTMADKSIHCVVVAGIERRKHGGERLAWGIVSDLDLVSALRPECGLATAGEIAATEIVLVEPADTLARAAQLMVEHGTAHLVVVSPESWRPVGMLSTLDIARAVAQ
jgi:CBS domain-containing protein